MFKIFLNVALIFILAGLEISGLAGRFFLNPYICFVIFFALFPDKKYFLWPILGGIILDFFSIFNFPFYTVSFLLIFLFIRLLSNRVINFKDFLSVIIFSFGGILVYNLIFLILNSASYLLNLDHNFIVFNNKYFLHLLVNAFFTFILLAILKRKYDRSFLLTRSR